ncbi:hypothetical protein ACROYT_G014203 [Oculina patagonica]
MTFSWRRLNFIRLKKSLHIDPGMQGSSPEDFLKTLPSNDPQLVCSTGEDDIRDPSSYQWFIVVDKEIVLECASPSGFKALIT